MAIYRMFHTLSSPCYVRISPHGLKFRHCIGMISNALCYTILFTHTRHSQLIFFCLSCSTSTHNNNNYYGCWFINLTYIEVLKYGIKHTYYFPVRNIWMNPIDSYSHISTQCWRRLFKSIKTIILFLSITIIVYNYNV